MVASESPENELPPNASHGFVPQWLVPVVVFDMAVDYAGQFVTDPHSILHPINCSLRPVPARRFASPRQAS
jgi:hypothetical protein